MIRDSSRTIKPDIAFPGLISSKSGNDVCDLPTAGTLGRRQNDVSRLLLILTEFPPSFGGMQTHAVHLCRYLHQRGYHIEVATYRGPAVEFPFPVHRCLSRIGITQNLHILESLTRIARPDLLYSSTIFYGRLSASTGIPMIARSVGNDVLRPWIVWPYGCFSRMLSTPWLEDRLYRRFRELEWPEAIESLLGLPKDRFILLTACRLVLKKGVDLLMRAVSKLPGTHLVIAGEGRQLPRCVALAEQLGIAHRVTFAGRIPHENLQYLYWAADQFVLASRDDRHLLGRTEFDIRDAVHRLGAQALQTALAERKKRGIKAQA